MRHHIQKVVFVLVTILGATSTTWADESVRLLECFDAMEQSVINAKIIPVDSKKATVLITNLTERPIEISMPAAFAAAPVLAQFGNGQGQGPGQGPGQGAGQQGGGGQTVGGGIQGGGNGRGQNGQNGNNQGNGFGAGMFRIPAGKTLRLKATTVCLEHGKPEPNPRIAYQMIRLSEFTDDASIAKLCEQVGNRELTQPVAQAAAWHLTDGLSWDTLAKMNQFESQYVGEIRFFDAKVLKEAKAFVKEMKQSKTLTSSQ